MRDWRARRHVEPRVSRVMYTVVTSRCLSFVSIIFGQDPTAHLVHYLVLIMLCSYEYNYVLLACIYTYTLSLVSRARRHDAMDQAMGASKR